MTECCARWDLVLGAPFEPATISYVAPVTRADGTLAVLKVNFPEPESEHEAAALAHWDGGGAVRLLASDPACRALLVERCTPGDQLWSVADEAQADRQAAAVLRRLWAAPPPAGHHVPHARRRGAALGGRAARTLGAPRAALRPGAARPRRRLDRRAARDDRTARATWSCIRTSTAGTSSAPRAGRWLAIDPKPLAGERAFDVGLAAARPRARSSPPTRIPRGGSAAASTA